MKKLIAIASAMLVFYSASIAQNAGTTTDGDDREKIQLGIKAGINISNIYDSDDDEFEADPKVGFAGGVFIAVPIGKYFGLQPEVLISQKGFTASSTFLGTDYRFTRTTTSIDVPIYLQFKPSKFITLLFGPQYSFLLKQNDKFEAGGLSSENEEEFENDNIRKNIFGVTTGLDININRFVIGGRLAWDLQKNKGDGSSETPRYKNAWGQVTVGIKF